MQFSSPATSTAWSRNMSNIDLVVTDIDDTMVPTDSHTPSLAVRDAMREVQARGVTVAAATARPYEAARDLFLELNFHGPSIFDGGASIRDVQTGKLQWQSWLELPRLKAIASILLPHAVRVDFFPEYKMLPAEEVDVASLAERAPYAWAMVSESALSEIMEKLQALPALNIHPGVGKPDEPGLVDIQVTDVNANKFHALTELRRLLRVTIEQTLAIGDSGNDLPLFQNAGVKVAMGNAIPALKAAADYEVRSVGEDGWAEAMRRFVLPNGQKL